MPLLVPIDLSAPSANAVWLAARLAPVLGCDVVLLHVADGPTPLDLLADLHALAQPLRDAGVQARLRIARGNPAEAIAQEAVRRGCEWIVMGTRGTQASGAHPAGSVAQAVMTRSAVSVAAIRPGDSNLPVGDGLAVAVVSGSYGSAADKLARILAIALHGQSRPFRVNHAHTGPLLLPDGPDSPGYGAAVLSYDPYCVVGSWCAQVVRSETGPVVLVSDPREPDTSCAMAQ